MSVDERLAFDIFSCLKMSRFKILHIITLPNKGLLQFIVLFFILQVIICLSGTVKQCGKVRQIMLKQKTDLNDL